jgi:anti-sigma regulatory factor (Ser/Thr protein kinase)
VRSQHGYDLSLNRPCPYNLRSHETARPFLAGHTAISPRRKPDMPFLYSDNLSEVRALAERQARKAGLPDARVIDFVIAVSEVAANTVRHAHSTGSMEIRSNATELVCEIRDRGVITDPMVGRQPPPPNASGGHGLWLVHQVCDRVELNSDENGTVVWLYMSLGSADGGRGREEAAR